MTVGYMRAAATAKLSTFFKLLFRWRGSVWKSVWRELLVWIWLYCVISIIYRFFIYDTMYQASFVATVQFLDKFTSQIRTSVTFVLGFYVNQVASRWWKVFMELPWPDNIGLSISAFYMDDVDEDGKKKNPKRDRITRSTIIRYLTLSYVLVFRDINERIRIRFPTYQHMVPYLMTQEEKKRIESEDIKMQPWVPIEWCLLLLKEAHHNDQITEDHHVILTEQILDFRTRLNNLLSYDWVNVPLVYSQVVNVALMTYFGIAVVAKQYLGIEDCNDIAYKVDFAIPIFTIFEFIFYVGWLKVAQVMINPFGMDDDDFDIDCLVDRHIKVGMSMVDNYFDKAPELKDLNVLMLPHTKASMKESGKGKGMIGSVANLKMKKEEMQPVFQSPEPTNHRNGSASLLKPIMRYRGERSDYSPLYAEPKVEQEQKSDKDQFSDEFPAASDTSIKHRHKEKEKEREKEKEKEKDKEKEKERDEKTQRKKAEKENDGEKRAVSTMTKKNDSGDSSLKVCSTQLSDEKLQAIQDVRSRLAKLRLVPGHTPRVAVTQVNTPVTSMMTPLVLVTPQDSPTVSGGTIVAADTVKQTPTVQPKSSKSQTRARLQRHKKNDKDSAEFLQAVKVAKEKEKEAIRKSAESGTEKAGEKLTMLAPSRQNSFERLEKTTQTERKTERERKEKLEKAAGHLLEKKTEAERKETQPLQESKTSKEKRADRERAEKEKAIAATPVSTRPPSSKSGKEGSVPKSKAKKTSAKRTVQPEEKPGN